MTLAQKEVLRDKIADQLVDMEPMFDRRCKLTFVMRSPHLPDGDLVVTSDDVAAVVAALQRLGTYEPVGKGTPDPAGATSLDLGATESA